MEVMIKQLKDQYVKAKSTEGYQFVVNQLIELQDDPRYELLFSPTLIKTKDGVATIEAYKAIVSI